MQPKLQHRYEALLQRALSYIPPDPESSDTLRDEIKQVLRGEEPLDYRGALLALVEAKMIKDAYGKTPEYVAAKHRAWERAESIIRLGRGKLQRNDGRVHNPIH